MIRFNLIPAILFAIQFASAQIITISDKANITEMDLRAELSIYPKHMLSMVKWIDIRDLQNNVSGLAHWNGVVLDGSYSKEICISTLHHELSSIFLKQPKYGLHYDLMRDDFYELNGKNLIYYTNNGYIDLAIVELTEIEKNYLAGNSYAKSSFDNDFNTIAELLFSKGRELIANVSARPNSVIQKKVFLVIEYYKFLDPKFDYNYFANR